MDAYPAVPPILDHIVHMVKNIVLTMDVVAFVIQQVMVDQVRVVKVLVLNMDDSVPWIMDLKVVLGMYVEIMDDWVVGQQQLLQQQLD